MDLTIVILFMIITILVGVWREYEGNIRGFKAGYEIGFKTGSSVTWNIINKKLIELSYLDKKQSDEFQDQILDELGKMIEQIDAKMIKNQSNEEIQ